MKRKALALLVTAIMVLGTAAPSFAVSETRDVSANYSGISLYIDLELTTLLDVNGGFVDPFILDGSTYLPVRAISEALGMNVEWDAAAKIVYIAETSEDAAPDESAPAAEAETEDAAATEETAATDVEAAAAEEAVEAEAEEAPATDSSVAPQHFIGVRTLTASFDDIKIFINDEEISPKDAAGNAVEPFIVSGTTYLPVRAVAEAFGLTVSWNAATKSVYIGEQPEATAAADSVFAEYLAATSAIEKANSFASDVKGSMSMTIGGQKTDMQISGSVKAIMSSDTDIEVLADTTANVAGQSVTAKIYYKDGVAYTEAAGEKIKMAMPLDDAVKLTQSENFDFSEDAIKDQSKSADGKELKFTFDGAKVTSIADELLGSLGSTLPQGSEYKFSDIVCTAVLDDAGAIKSEHIVFSAEMTADGAAVSIDYDLTVAYSQVGSVTITAPTDLASYKEAQL
ncbi:MAG: copper amine oxidase N-terminal domain-containing protein [Clostridiales Family XIII bacterium]|jgi:hypothetical protein|nr:copper amine oxidase N-terminal domain-containing protein [Clostridiales Family XIII bacterium]